MQMHKLASLTQMSGKGHMRSTNEIKPRWKNSTLNLFSILYNSCLVKRLNSFELKLYFLTYFTPSYQAYYIRSVDEGPIK